jgi:hypothetical protein
MGRVFPERVEAATAASAVPGPAADAGLPTELDD